MNFFNSFGCYIMSLMLLNVFVLKKFLWFFELVIFVSFVIFMSYLCLFILF